MKFFREHNISTFDAAAMTLGLRELHQQLNETRGATLYWDQVHYLAPIYAGLNKALLDFICNDDKEE